MALGDCEIPVQRPASLKEIIDTQYAIVKTGIKLRLVNRVHLAVCSVTPPTVPTSGSMFVVMLMT